MEGKIPKQFMELNSCPILVHTLRVFENSPVVDKIVLAIPAKEQQQVTTWIDQYKLRKSFRIVRGGPRRQDSVYNGLRAIGEEIDIVLVHDGVRPLVTPRIIEACAKEAIRTGAAITAVPVKDTIKETKDGRTVFQTLDRDRLWAVQTPQGFRKEILERAMEKAVKEYFIGTDEASLVERLNVPVSIIEGSYENIKITTPADLLFAESTLKIRKNKQRFL